jgi:hypothetical protein
MAKIKKEIAKKGVKEIVKKVKPKPKPKPKPRPVSKVSTKTASVKAAEQKARQNVVRDAAIATGVLGIGTAALLNSKNKSGKTFNDAFRAARAKGEGTKFTFNGKSYVAVTKDDLKKKGYSTLAEYNRAGGKKKIDVDAAAKKIADAVNKNKKPKTMRERIKARRKKRIGFETFKERRQARRAARKMKSGGVVSSKKSTPRGVGAAKRGFGKALK